VVVIVVVVVVVDVVETWSATCDVVRKSWS